MLSVTRRSRLLLALALFAAALGIAAWRVTTRSDVGGIRLGASWALSDFRTNIHYPVRAFIEGGNPYDRAAYLARYPVLEGFPPYLPSTLAIHLPLGFMPLTLAQLCYVGVTVILIVVLARFALRSNGDPSWTSAAVAAALVALSRPGQWNLLLGQVTLQAVLASWVALRYARHSPWVSGLALGAATFKPTFGVPLAVLMLARGDVKAVAAGVLSGLALTLPVVAILGQRTGGARFLAQGQTDAYYEWTGDSDSWPNATLYRLDLVALVGRITGRALSHAEELVITVIVLALAALLVRRLRRIETTPDQQPLSEAIICIAVLLCVHHLDYDLLLLVFPFVALIYGRVPGLLQERTVRRVTLALFALLAVNYVSTQSVLDRLEPTPAIRFLVLSFNSLVLLTIFAIYAVATLRATSVRPAGAHAPAAGAASQAARGEPVSAGHA